MQTRAWEGLVGLEARTKGSLIASTLKGKTARRFARRMRRSLVHVRMVAVVVGSDGRE
jgi:hypothetical protein